MNVLKSKLVELAEREHKDKIDDLKGVQTEIGWGNQIRSYVLPSLQHGKGSQNGL